MLSNILDRVSFWSLFLTVVLLPIFFLPASNIPVDTSKGFLLIIGIVISLISWTAARFSDGKIVLPKSILLASFGFVSLTTLISTIFSSSFKSSFFGVMFDTGSFWFIFSLFLISLITSLVVKDSSRAKKILTGFAVTSLLLFIFQIVRFFLPNTLSLGIFSQKTDNLFGSWNSLGIFAGLNVLVGLFLLEFFNLAKKYKIFFSVLLLVSVFMVASINFDLVWKLLGIFSLVLFVYKISLTSFGSQDIKDNKTFPFYAFGIIILSLLFIMSGKFIGTYLPNTLGLSSVEVNPSFGATANVFQGILKNDPVFGIGPNRFSDAWSLYKTNVINTSQFWNTPFSFGFGTIPTFMITGGLLTFISWLFFLVILLIAGIKNTFLSIKGDNDTDLVIYFVSALYLVIASIFYVASVPVLVLAFVMLGIFIGIYSNRFNKVINFSFLDDPRKSFFAILFLVILMLATSGLTFKYLEKFTSVHYFSGALQSDNIETVENKLRKGLLLNQNDLYLRTYAQLYLSKINTLLNGKTSLTDEDKVALQFNIDQAINAATLAKNFNKNNYLNSELLGFVYKNTAALGIKDSTTKAIESYQEAIKLNPLNPGLHLEVARLYLLDKNNIEAKNFALKSIELKPDFGQGLLFLAELEKSNGNLNSAISYAEQALFYFPGDKELSTYVSNLKSGRNTPTVTNDDAPTTENN